MTHISDVLSRIWLRIIMMEEKIKLKSLITTNYKYEDNSIMI